MRLLSIIEKYEKLDEKKREMFVEIIHGQARYTFGDCNNQIHIAIPLRSSANWQKSFKIKRKTSQVFT